MAQFKDAEKRPWDVEVNGGTIKRCLKYLGADRGKPMEKSAEEGAPLPPLLRYFDDVVFMVDTIYLACYSQAVERNISDDGFAALLAGDVLAEASAAFLDELSAFFLQIGRIKTYHVLLECFAKLLNFQQHIGHVHYM